MGPPAVGSRNEAELLRIEQVVRSGFQQQLEAGQQGRGGALRRFFRKARRELMLMAPMNTRLTNCETAGTLTMTLPPVTCLTTKPTSLEAGSEVKSSPKMMDFVDCRILWVWPRPWGVHEALMRRAAADEDGTRSHHRGIRHPRSCRRVQTDRAMGAALEDAEAARDVADQVLQVPEPRAAPHRPLQLPLHLHELTSQAQQAQQQDDDCWLLLPY